MRRAVFPSAVIAASMLVVACGDGGSSKVAVDSANPIVAAPQAGSATNCPATGLWAQCSVFKRLEQAGLNVLTDSVQLTRREPLAIPGIELPIARGRITIFLYADSVSRARDELKLDKLTFVVAPAEPTMTRTRTLIRSGNMLVLMDVARGANRERIANALLAGPPQPPRPRP